MNRTVAFIHSKVFVDGFIHSLTVAFIHIYFGKRAYDRHATCTSGELSRA